MKRATRIRQPGRHDGIEENLMKKNSKKQELIRLAIVLIICFIIMIQLAFLVINRFCGLL